jgi:acetylglutamate kinase
MRVVKIGGRAQIDPRVPAMFRQAWGESRNGLCLVHGGGDEISAMQRALGREALFVGGRRVTSKSDLELLRMVLSGVVNKRLVNALVTEAIPAVGVSGEDDSLIGAKVIDGCSLGFVGHPTTINVGLLRTLLGAGYLPVISPVAYDASSGKGGALNVNGDDAAAAIAASLEADELLLITDVEGVYDDRGSVIPNLDVQDARELVVKGVAEGGMAAKLESAHAALAAGVNRVRISDLVGLVDAMRGTFITQSEGVVS